MFANRRYRGNDENFTPCKYIVLGILVLLTILYFMGYIFSKRSSYTGGFEVDTSDHGEYLFMNKPYEYT